MAETSPSSPEKTVIVNPPSLCLWKTLTGISLALNALILLGIVACAIIHHHHHKHHGFGGHGGRDGGQCQMGGGHRLHQFGGMRPGGNQGWGKPGGFGGEKFGGMGNGGPGMMHGGPSMGNGGPGMMHGGPGMGGMPGMMGGPMGKADPEKMTDMILNHLTETLTLTDDEKTKIKPIIEAQVADMQKQMEAQHAAMQKQLEDAKAKLKPLLTADQQKQLDAMPLPGQKPGQ